MALNGCCFMSLRTAGLVLGWLGLAMSAITISSIMNHLTRYDHFEELDDELPIRYRRHRTVQGDVILLTISIFNVLVTGLMINGITTNKHRFLLPWLIVKGLGLILAIPIGFLILFCAAMTAQPIHIAVSVLLILIIGFCCWCWMAIYSLYKEIRDTSKKSLTFFENGALNGATVPYQLFEKY